MQRKVENEWLDELPANDPVALASRRDIQRLNGLMGHRAAMRELLKSATGGENPRRLVEIGAGDGIFALELARDFAAVWPRMEVILVDCKDVVADETRGAFAALGWKTEIVTADVFDWLRKPDAPPADVMLTNLFLHQFTDAQLTAMLGLAAAKTRLFAACEPRRAALPLALSQMVGVIGCNRVTRHDAPVSVRAGFAGREISALWPGDGNGGWRLQERRAGILSHTFLAQRDTAN